jgi:hypothetical protein
MKGLPLMVAGALALALSNEASAGKKSFDLDFDDFQAGVPAEDVPGSGVKLGDTGLPVVYISLTLPKDFKKNSTAILRLIFVGPSTACTYNITTGYAARRRVGKVVQSLSGPASGYTTAVAGPTPAPASSVLFAKDFKIGPATAGVFSGSQKASDRVTLVVSRDGTSGSDTCTSDLYLTDGRLFLQDTVEVLAGARCAGNRANPRLSPAWV